MIALIESSFDDYLKAGEETVRELHNADGALVQGLRAYHDFFVKKLWVYDDDGTGPVAGLISMHSFMLFLAGIRMAMTGHVAAIFPIQRTALEAACYAFLISKDRRLESVWANRHNNDASRKACRNCFGGAARDTANMLNAIQCGSGDCVLELYEVSIDFGAHPNPRSVMEYATLSVDESNAYRKLDLAGLYDSSAWMTSRALMACMDYGQVIATVLARCIAKPSQELGAQLFELNEMKERLATQLQNDSRG